MKFTKMQCAGNDFIIFTCFDEKPQTPDAMAEVLCDRRFGIGADCLIIVMKSDEADYKIRIFKPDGSEEEVSGNGLCCVGKFLVDNNFVSEDNFNIETASGIKNITVDGEYVTVNMGEPILTPQIIPVDYTGDEFINKFVTVDNDEYAITCVSVGNPHACLYPDDLYNMDIETIGRGLELHQIFPKRTNIEFIKVIDGNTLDLRVWSRGNGEIYSSGSGACGAVVSTYLAEKCNRKVTVRHIGGELLIEWNVDDNNIYLTAKPEKSFECEKVI